MKLYERIEMRLRELMLHYEEDAARLIEEFGDVDNAQILKDQAKEILDDLQEFKEDMVPVIMAHYEDHAALVQYEDAGWTNLVVLADYGQPYGETEVSVSVEDLDSVIEALNDEVDDLIDGRPEIETRDFLKDLKQRLNPKVELLIFYA